MDIAWRDGPANYDRVRRLLAQAAPARGDLVVLPEMFDTGFALDPQRTADREQRTLAFLEQLARQYGVYVQGGRTVLTADGQRGLNVAPVMAPDGRCLVEYAKIHPFSFGREHERFAGGEEVVTYRWVAGEGAGLVVCPAICYDLRFPELFRRGLRAGAELFAIGANWPAERQAHWRALLVARAIENQAYVLGVNRVGRDPRVVYAGGSLAVDPRGQVVGELGDQEGVLAVELDAGEVVRWRAAFPAWRDMRLIDSRRVDGDGPAP